MIGEVPLVMDLESMQSSVEEASTLLKSLANPSRLLVLCALVTREHTAGELEELTGLSQSAISQHLARLRDEQIVGTRREAQRIYYSLTSAEVRTVIETLHGIYCAEQ
jgi:DNA-binding transcriptional ArsR family regulator